MTATTVTHDLWVLAHRKLGVMLPAHSSQDAWALALASAHGLTDPGSVAFKRKKAEMRSQGWMARRCKMVVDWS